MNVLALMATLGLNKTAFDEGLDDAQKDASSFGSKLKSGLATAAKGATVAIGAVTGASVAMGKGLVNATGDLASYGDNIDKMSQKMGMTAEAYQEWDAVMQHSGTSMETLKASMKTLASAAESGSEAFEELGITQEELANMSQQELFERTISALQNVENETTRTYLAGKTLGRGATELGALLNTSAEDTEAMRQRVHELGGVMSDDAVKASAAYQDSLQDLQTSFSGISRGLTAEFLPGVTSVMDGLTSIFAGEDGGVEMVSSGISDILTTFTESIPRFTQIAKEILTGLTDAITENLPEIVSAATDIIITLATGLVDNLPTLLSTGIEILGQLLTSIQNAFPDIVQTGVEMLQNLGQGIKDNLPEFLQTAVESLTSFVGTLADNLGLIVDAGLELIMTLADALIDNLPTLMDAVPEIIAAIVKVITENLPKIIETGMTLIEKLIKGIIDMIPTLIENMGKIVSAVWDTISSVDWIGLGKDVINWLKDGIVNLFNVLPDKLKEIGDKAVEFLSGIDWIQLGKDVITFIANGIADLVTKIPEALLNIGSAAWDAVTNIDWLDLGGNIISGIADGITGGLKKIKDAAASAAQSALDTAKSWLGIKSPSRVFRDQVGKQMAAGMGIGFEDNVPTDDMVAGVSDALDEIAALDAPTLTADMTEMAPERPGMFGGNVINVYPSEGMDEQALAEKIDRVLTRKTRREEVAYA